MGKLAYINGQYIPHHHATISINDRGLQFGDAVYEVFAVFQGKNMDEELHMDRLQFSLKELDIPMPFTRKSFSIIVKNLMSKNRMKTGMVYIQVSRGTYPRDHYIPNVELTPNVIITTKNVPIETNADKLKSIKVITAPDIRWGRVDIKTIMLLPNCMAKTEALKQGATEILFVKDGIVTESASANFSFIDTDGNIVTAPKGDILLGITRHTLIECAHKLQIKVIERKFTLEEVHNATEAFISSAAKLVTPISHIDNVAVGNGDYPKIKRLHDEYMKKTISNG